MNTSFMAMEEGEGKREEDAQTIQKTIRGFAHFFSSSSYLLVVSFTSFNLMGMNRNSHNHNMFCEKTTIKRYENKTITKMHGRLRAPSIWRRAFRYPPGHR
eukprot:gene9307-6546_t